MGSGDIEGLLRLIEDDNHKSWPGCLTSGELSEKPALISRHSLGFPAPEDGCGSDSTWLAIAEQALYLLWDALEGIAEIMDCEVEVVYRAELNRLVQEEAAGHGAHSLIVACLQRRIEAGQPLPNVRGSIRWVGGDEG